MSSLGSQQEPPGSYFTPLLISMAGIVALSLAIVAYHLLVVRFCLRLRRGRLGGAATDTETSLSEPVPDVEFTGVEEKVLDTIPILPYSTDKPDLFRLDQSECVVCLADLEDGDTVRLLPNCRHAFHIPCIDKWFMAHTSCPVCRSPIVRPDPIVPEIESSTVSVSGSSGESSGAQARETVLNDGGHNRVGEDPGSYDGEARHCLSFMLPLEAKRELVKGLLKRSLSMDQCYLLTINVQRDGDQKGSSSPSPSSSPSVLRAVLMRSRSYRLAEIRQLDRMSTVLLRSLGQLRMGRSNGLLPY